MNTARPNIKGCMLSLLVIATISVQAQKLALKTNLPYWLTTTPNIGVEWAVSQKISLELSGGYNPWTFLPDYMSLRHYQVLPEVRYWFKQPFSKHFLGIHAVYSRYNIGKIPFIPPLEEHVYKGNDYGGGITYGYQIKTGKRWNLEFSIGAGYLYRDYDKYLCIECEDRLDHYKKHYFGITKAAIAIIFFIN